MKDDILQQIDLMREGEELLLPKNRFAGGNAKYLKLGVFKKSPKIIESVPCPNGCGEMVKVLARTDRGYLVVCDHGDKPSEDIYLPPEEVELYKLDWVMLQRCVEGGAIDYVRPSTPEERKRDAKAAKAWLCEIARRIQEHTKWKPLLVKNYMMSDAKCGDAFWGECQEVRELKRIHSWQDNTFYTYVREALSGAAPSQATADRAKRQANARKRKKDLDAV